MAELHRVEINEKAPNEIEPVDETVETPEEQQAEPQAEETTERPEWLPEKFKSAEDMAQAYAELEKRMGQGTKEVEETEQPEEQQEEQTDDNKEEVAMAAPDGIGLDIGNLHVRRILCITIII